MGEFSNPGEDLGKNKKLFEYIYITYWSSRGRHICVQKFLSHGFTPRASWELLYTVFATKRPPQLLFSLHCKFIQLCSEFLGWQAVRSLLTFKMKASHYMPEHGKTDRFRVGTVEIKYLPSGDMVS